MMYILKIYNEKYTGGPNKNVTDNNIMAYHDGRCSEKYIMNHDA